MNIYFANWSIYYNTLKMRLYTRLCLLYVFCSLFGIVSVALGAGQHLVEQLPGLLVARDVEEHHDAAQHSVQDGEASVQRRVLNNQSYLVL